MASPQTVQMLKELHAMADPSRINDEADTGAVMEAQYAYFQGVKQLAAQNPELEQRIQSISIITLKLPMMLVVWALSPVN